jgi:VIT1/CCC1 family predicted Fe2+/Mn2+ transporter
MTRWPHVVAELRLDPDDLANPLQAAVASAASVTVGAPLPLLAILLPPATFRLPITFVTVLIALGWRVRSAHVSQGAAAAAPCCG